MLLATIFEEHCDSLKSIFRLLHNEKRAVHNITVYCEERYAERKNKEKSCYTDFQETDFRVLAQGGKISAPVWTVAFASQNKEGLK